MDAPETLTTLRTVLELGWPAIVMVAIVIMWRAYKFRTDQLIDSKNHQIDALQRQNEIYLGVILDNAKMTTYDPSRMRFPGVAESRRLDDTSPPAAAGD